MCKNLNIFSTNHMTKVCKKLSTNQLDSAPPVGRLGRAKWKNSAKQRR